MGISKSDAERKVKNIFTHIFKHLVKILKWDDPVNYDKHIADIDNWIYDLYILKLKPNGRPISGKLMYAWLFGDDLDSMEDVEITVRILSKSYSKLPVLLTNEQLYARLTEIYGKLSQDIDQRNFESIDTYL
jgi:hypothetical protein